MMKPFTQKAIWLTAFSALFLLWGTQLISFTSGGPSGRSGSPIDVGTCATRSCHGSFTLDSGPGSVSLTSNIPAVGYSPGDTYQITVSMAQAERSKFGFQAMCYGERTMKGTGSITATDATRTIVNATANAQYVTHRSAGTSGTNMASWTFDWTSPENDEDVTFYAVGNAANNNGNASGDHIYSTNETFKSANTVNIDAPKEIESLYTFTQNDYLVVSWQSNVFAPITLTLQTMDGKEVYRLEDDLVPGTSRIEIPVYNLAKSTYLLRATTPQTNLSQKVMPW